MSEVEVVRTALRHAAKNVDRRLRSINGSGSPGDLRGRGALSTRDLGDWDAGQALAVTMNQTHHVLTQQYEGFLAEVEGAVSALLRVAEAYDSAEELTEKQIRAVLGDAGVI